MCWKMRRSTFRFQDFNGVHSGHVLAKVRCINANLSEFDREQSSEPHQLNNGVFSKDGRDSQMNNKAVSKLFES